MVDRTEGIDPQKIRYPLIHRNLPAQTDADEDYIDVALPIFYDEGLMIRISQNNYHMQYESYTADWFLHSAKQQQRGLSAYEEIKQARKKGLKALVEDKAKNGWLRNAAEGEVEKMGKEFREWIQPGSTDEKSEPVATSAAAVDEDQVMSGV